MTRVMTQHLLPNRLGLSGQLPERQLESSRAVYEPPVAEVIVGQPECHVAVGGIDVVGPHLGVLEEVLVTVDDPRHATSLGPAQVHLISGTDGRGARSPRG